MSFWSEHQQILIKAGVSILVLVLAYLASRLIKRGIDRFSKRRDLSRQDPGTETRVRMIQRLSSVVIFFVAIGLVFWVVDVSALKRVAAGMFASAGVFGIAVAFAAQTTMSNLVSGVIIAFSQPIRLGDNVDIDGEYGTVESIGLFYCNIRTWDNRRIVVPNKLLSDGYIRNYTLVDSQMPALVSLKLDFGTDVEMVRSLLLEEARAHRLFLSEPEPAVQVIRADALGVTVRLVAWTATQGDAWTLAVEVRESAIARLASLSTPVWVRWSRIIPEAKSS